MHPDDRALCACAKIASRYPSHVVHWTNDHSFTLVERYGRSRVMMNRQPHRRSAPEAKECSPGRCARASRRRTSGWGWIRLIELGVVRIRTELCNDCSARAIGAPSPHRTCPKDSGLRSSKEDPDRARSTFDAPHGQARTKAVCCNTHKTLASNPHFRMRT